MLCTNVKSYSLSALGLGTICSKKSCYAMLLRVVCAICSNEVIILTFLTSDHVMHHVCDYEEMVHQGVMVGVT